MEGSFHNWVWLFGDGGYTNILPTIRNRIFWVKCSKVQLPLRGVVPSTYYIEGKVCEMEIERINEHTVKFYISYLDIEERGFDRDEIWYNRERSEELFWEMMDEVHEEEEFMVEGPLWIQIQALDKGLEVIVTKAQVAKDGQKFELPFSDDKLKEIPVDDNVSAILEQNFNHTGTSKDELIEEEDQQLQFVIKFNDLENLISLSKYSLLTGMKNHLYSLDGNYYLFIEFNYEVLDEEIENTLSIILEYGQESRVTIHRLEEYGKVIAKEHALKVIKKHFA
jgi:adapter protein MecA 1/2